MTFIIKMVAMQIKEPHIEQSSRTFFVCHGSDCRKKSKEFKAVTALLSTQGHVCPVKCQKICKGPVVGAQIGGRLEWFSKLGNRHALKQFVLLLENGDLRKRLRARIAKKRQGKLRGKVSALPQTQAA